MRDGWLAQMDVRNIGLAVVALGGGRVRPGERIDPRVGLSAVVPPGTTLRPGDTLALVHAASEDTAAQAVAAVQAALRVGDAAPAAGPLVLQSVQDGAGQG